MTPVHLLNLVAHIGAGMLGLIAGLIPLLSRKGSARHRRWGRYFRVLASVVVASAILSDLFGSPAPALIAVTLSAAYQFIGSLRALALRGRAPNRWDAALACAALVAGALLLTSTAAATRSFTPTIEYSTVAWVAVIALYDLSRHLWPSVWSRYARPLDHGLKMTGVYFAMASAGAGNLLRDLQPWSQLLPTALGIVTMCVLAVVYWPRRARAFSPDAVPESA